MEYTIREITVFKSNRPMNKFITIILATFLLLPAFAQNDSRAEIDSLHKIAADYFMQQNFRQSGEYSLKAMEICKKIGDMECTAQYAYAAGISHYIAGNCHEALELFLIALNYYKELKNYGRVFNVYNAIGNTYHYLRDNASRLKWTQEALKLAQETGETHYEAVFNNTCGNATRVLGDTVQALAYFDRALELFRKIDNKPEIIKTLNNMAIAHDSTSVEKLKLFMEAARVSEEITPQSETVLSHLSHIYCNIGDWYAKVNSHDSAALYFDKAIFTVQQSGDKFLMIFMYSHLAEYYAKRGDRQKAKQLAQETIDIINETVGKNHTYDRALKLLSAIYAQEGDFRRAFETLQQWSAVNDTIKARAAREELMNINSRYDFERHRQERINTQQRTIERNRIYMIFAISACLLILAGWLFHSRRMTEKNRGLYRQIKEQDRLAEELEKMTNYCEHLMKGDKKGARDNVSVNLSGIEQQRELVASMRAYLLQDKNFTKPDIFNSKFFTELLTNRTYLYDATKAVIGKTPNEYIQHMRLEEAKHLLETDPKITIEIIAENCGFGSRSTFYALFTEHYNISPAKYRKTVFEKI